MSLRFPSATHRSPLLELTFNRVMNNANTLVLRILSEIEISLERDRTCEPAAEGPADPEELMLLRPDIPAFLRARECEIISVGRSPYARILSAFLGKFREFLCQRRYGPFELTPTGVLGLRSLAYRGE